jgi:hypothetical protein
MRAKCRPIERDLTEESINTVPFALLTERSRAIARPPGKDLTRPSSSSPLARQRSWWLAYTDYQFDSFYSIPSLFFLIVTDSCHCRLAATWALAYHDGKRKKSSLNGPRIRPWSGVIGSIVAHIARTNDRAWSSYGLRPAQPVPLWPGGAVWAGRRERGQSAAAEKRKWNPRRDLVTVGGPVLVIPNFVNKIKYSLYICSIVLHIRIKGV